MRALIERKWDEAAHPLDTNVTIDLATAFPSGAHVAEVEIDPETGAARIVNYVAADDCGTIYNHTLVEGQLHGGLMQGIGQVFGEHIAYDPGSGQLLSGSFMDYFMPRAEHLAPTHADRLRRAFAGQCARRQGRGRGRRHRVDPDARQRGPRCAQAARTCGRLKCRSHPSASGAPFTSAREAAAARKIRAVGFGANTQRTLP